MRQEIVRIPIDGSDILATLSLPEEIGRGQAILLLNAGHVPRNGHGGVSAELANIIASRGRPVLRADLPGLGDSPGLLPERIEDFWVDIKSGGHTRPASAVIDWVSRNLSIDKICLGGVCGAALTAVFTADRFPNKVDSLLLIEPELFTNLPPQIMQNENNTGSESNTHRLLIVGQKAFLAPFQRLTSSWQWMRLISRRHDNAPWLSAFQRMILQTQVSLGTMPDRTNLHLVQAWARNSSRRVPTLLITARGLLWESYFMRLRRHLYSPSDNRIRHKSIAKANHVFSNKYAREALFKEIPDWLETIDR